MGQIDRLNVHQPSRPPVSWPHQVGVLPPEADAFLHRGAVDTLESAMAEGGTTVLGQVLAGTGGVGKTQLAAHYARHSLRAGAMDLLVWVTASSRPAIVTGYGQAGIEVAGADPGEPEQAAARFVSWLETTERRWLVVLDDLADPADLRGLWLPGNPGGRVVITTRRRDAALTSHGRRLIEVGLFTTTEATEYLTARLASFGRGEPAKELAALAQDLGYLPLALAQAAAYLLDLGLEVVDYRQRLADRRRTLADLMPDDSSLPDDQHASLAATWSLSIERADRLRPEGLARPMLELASLLDPNGIPQLVLTSQPALAYLATHRTPPTWKRDQPGSRHEVTSEDAADALRCLQRLSLVEHLPQTSHRAVRVHNLIQRAAREVLADDRRDVVAHAVADALVAVWPQVERDTTLAQILRANTDALTICAGTALWQPVAHLVLFRSGRSLGEAGLVAAAITNWQQLCAAAQDHLGPDHPDTLTIRHNFAYWRGVAGDAAGAAAATAEVLKDFVRVLGPDHPNTLSTRSNLGRWRAEAGDAAGAVAATEKLLEDRLRVLGPDHPDILRVRHNLAYSRGAAGDAAGAAAAFRQLLEDFERVHGPDHPDTLTTRANLADWRARAGDAAGAAAATEKLLEDRLRVLGPDHPDTLTTRHHLAYWRGVAGDAAGAAAATEELLEDVVRVLGPDHPDTLSTRHNLGRWRGEAGDATGAAAATAEVLEDLVRVHGPDHPHTLNARANVAYWRGVAGDAAGAAIATEELLKERLRVLGHDHPDTLTTQGNLARWRGAAGDAAGAAAAFRQLLEDFVRVHGPDHPHTQDARDNLAYWQGRAGKNPVSPNNLDEPPSRRST